jgi:hypothetical protein
MTSHIVFVTHTASLPSQNYIFANKLAWLFWGHNPSQCFHDLSYSHDPEFETPWQRWTFFVVPPFVWVSYDCNWYRYELPFWWVYSFSLSQSTEQVSSVWSQALQCHQLHVPFAYQSLTKNSWTGLAIRLPWIRSSQRWDVRQYTVSSQQIFEFMALRYHSLSLPKAFYCVRYYDCMNRLFMQQLTNSLDYNPSLTLNKSSVSQEIPHIFWNPAVFTRTHRFSLSWSRSVQSIPSHTYVLILFSHLHLRFTSGLLCSGFLTKTLYEFLFSPHASFTEYPIPF